jgi:hypothetical protein
VVLAALLWQHPNYLYGASLFSFSAVTFAMTELDLSIAQLPLGWVSLALLHIIFALRVRDGLARPLVVAGYVIAGLAIFPPLFTFDRNLLAYALGNWLGLAAWGARLAWQGQPGFAAQGGFRRTIFHWLTVLPLPFWLWLLFANRGPLGADFPLTLVALAWGMLALGFYLSRKTDYLLKPDSAYRWPWYLTGLAVSVFSPIVAFIIVPNGFIPASCLLAVGLLYLADALANRQSKELTVAGLVLAWGLALLLERLHASYDVLTCGLALLSVAYILVGMWVERRRWQDFPHSFLRPLYWAAHLLVLAVLWRIYFQPLDLLVDSKPWTDAMQLWAAGIQVLLAGAYVV